MDGGDGCHVAWCGGAAQQYGTIIDPATRLRFRPIAPKPVAGGAFPGVISPEKAAAFSSTKRVKRKYVRVRKADNSRRKRGNGNGSSAKTGEPVTVTLRLMPERSDGGDSGESLGSGSDRREGAGEVPAVETWVTVEGHVTDTCMEGLWCTDEERVRDLESDACPGFVSDASLSKVEWVNEAYRSMVAGLGGGRRPEVVVRLSAASKLGICTDGPGSGSFFTCRVRVEYYVRNNDNNNNNVEKHWKIIPCDVWRLDCGGFAWRLDVKAALSLGL